MYYVTTSVIDAGLLKATWLVLTYIWL